MKLQLALDEFDLEQSLALAQRVREYVDIIEIGTPFVIRCGVEAVRAFVEAFPEKEILADLKIMDGGYFETVLALDAGASYVTVLGVTDDATIKGCYDAVREHGGSLVVDMVCVGDLTERVVECEVLGADVLAVHTGVDQQTQGRTPLDDLRVMKAAAQSAKVAVAGGISSSTIEEYLALDPDIVIVGGAISHADDPVAEARAIKLAMENAHKSRKE